MKGIISYHFAGKTDVLREVVHSVLAEAEEAMTPGRRLQRLRAARGRLRKPIPDALQRRATSVIAVAGGANLIGGDRRSLRLSVLTPGSIRPEITGRQLAWLLLVGPYWLALGVLLTASSGQRWA